MACSKGKAMISKFFTMCLNRLFLVLQVRVKALIWKQDDNNIRPKFTLFQKLISLGKFSQVEGNLWSGYWNLFNMIFHLCLGTSGVYLYTFFFLIWKKQEIVNSLGQKKRGGIIEKPPVLFKWKNDKFLCLFLKPCKWKNTWFNLIHSLWKF